MKDFFAELRRRHVFRVGIAYLVVAWLVTQVVVAVSPVFELPAWFPRAVLILLITGFPFALIAAWAFDLTPDGIKRTSDTDAPAHATISSGRKLDFVIIGGLVLALGYFVWQQYYAAPRQTTAQNVSEPTAASGPPSLAVLPFADLSANKDQGYFADGVTEELLNSLAQLNDLKVTGRTSSFYFKGKNEDLRTVGKMLGVQNILEGSVRKAGNEVRITAQLINAETGYHLWSKTYDRKLDDIFAVQDNIAMSVAEAIGVTLGVGSVGHMPGTTRNVTAWDEFLAGNNVADYTDNALQSAIGHLERAVALDPNFALAWFVLSEVYVAAEGTIPDKVQNAVEKSKQALERARKLAPNAPYILARAGADSAQAGKWAEAERFLNAAIASGITIEGDNIDVLRGQFLYRTGRVGEAVSYLERERSVDPLAPGIAFWLMNAYAATGNLQAALQEANRGSKLAGGQQLSFLGPVFFVALVSGDRAEIDKWLARLPKVPSGPDPNVTMVNLLSDRAAALKQLRLWATDPAYQPEIYQYLLSTWAAYFGDQEFALRPFQSFGARDVGSALYAIWRPIYRDMRKLPGFKDYVRQIGLVDYWRKSGDWGDFCHPAGNDDFVCE